MPATAQDSSHRRLAARVTALPPGAAPPGSRGVILDAALHLFAERGYGATSVRDMAAASGVQPATLYAHYPSKEHVLAEICKLGHEAHGMAVRDALLETGADPRAQVRAFVRAHVLFHARYSMLGVVCNSEMHLLSPALGAGIFELRQRNTDLLVKLIERGIALGQFRVPNAWLATAMIGSPGIRVANWFTPDFEVPATAVADAFVLFALRLLGADEESPEPPRRRSKSAEPIRKT